jgi:predicted small secreted protein
MKTVFFRPALALAFLLTTASLSACNTGTDSGDTNVERSDDKTKDPDSGQRATSNTTGTANDTAHVTTGKELYDHAGDAKDRNNDGIEDK